MEWNEKTVDDCRKSVFYYSIKLSPKLIEKSSILESGWVIANKIKNEGKSLLFDFTAPSILKSNYNRDNFIRLQFDETKDPSLSGFTTERGFHRRLISLHSGLLFYGKSTPGSFAVPALENRVIKARVMNFIIRYLCHPWLFALDILRTRLFH